jgi:hyperosmotically inducible protein
VKPASGKGRARRRRVGASIAEAASPFTHRRPKMNNTTLHAWIAAPVIALAGLFGSGCAVSGGQSTVGQYVDDATITTRVKARMAEDKTVSAMRINVETLNGTVQLSGFATTAAEKEQAAALARGVPDVKGVRNDIVVRTGG